VTATLAWHPEADAEIAVAAVPDAGFAEVEAPWSPRYRDIRTGRRLTWTAHGAEIVFASVLGGGEPRLRHEAGVTTVELPQVRLTERWAGPTIESEG
jgi:hypothetical protein